MTLNVKGDITHIRLFSSISEFQISSCDFFFCPQVRIFFIYSFFKYEILYNIFDTWKQKVQVGQAPVEQRGSPFGVRLLGSCSRVFWAENTFLKSLMHTQWGNSFRFFYSMFSGKSAYIESQDEEASLHIHSFQYPPKIPSHFSALKRPTLHFSEAHTFKNFSTQISKS